MYGLSGFMRMKALQLSARGQSWTLANTLTGQIQGKQTILEVFKCEESV